MEAEFIFETFVLMYQISLRHIPDDRKLKHMCVCVCVYIYMYVYKMKIL